MPDASEGGTSGGAASTPGKDAVEPRHIPAGGWRLILLRAGRRVIADQLPLLSAGIAFFAVLSIAPVLVTALSLYGAVNTPAQALEQLSGVAEVLPVELEAIVADQLISITAASTEVLTLQGITALAIALWTATTAMLYLIDALTLAYREVETRGFNRRAGLALGAVLGGALLLGGVISASGVVARAMVGAPDLVRVVIQVLVWMSLAVLMVAALSVLYRFAPSRVPASWHWISWGAMGATGLWLAASGGLFAFVQTLGTYERTYGSLAGVAISMFWLWVSILLVIVGAVVNAESERQTARDSTVGPERALGSRGAVVADSAPPYQGEE